MEKKIDLNDCEKMLSATRTLILHQKDKEQLRGEKFNIFSVLKMETRENDTHSAFLAELLNPKGSHLRGTLFLELFLNCFSNNEDKASPENNKFDLSSAMVKTEHYIGQRNDTNKTGGRIDIYIWDKNNNCICIENKIYAVDQYAQIERYCNHNKGNNKVLYLTLWGSKPSIDSIGSIKEHEFQIISYKKHIIEWLTLCMKEVHDYPILRETIKQYILLLKKLTHTMNNEEENELFGLILKNYDEALFISENINKALAKFKGRIRESVFKQLQEKLEGRYSIYKGSSVESSYSQIWIKINGKEEQKLFFGIQSFSVGKDNFFGQLFVGIFVFEGKYQDDYISLGRKRSNWWLEDFAFENFKGFNVDLCDPETLKKLYSDQVFYQEFINYIVEKSIEYISLNHDKVDSFLKEK